MKNTTKILILISIVLFGCKKTEYVEKAYSWKQHSEITYSQKYLLNSYPTTNGLMLLGDGFLTTVDTSNHVSTTLGIDNVHSAKLPLSEKVLIRIPEGDNKAGRINFYYIPQLGQYLKPASVQISSFDSIFWYFNGVGSNKTMFAFNNSNQLLIPYIKGMNYLDQTLDQSFALITFNINPNANPALNPEDYFISISDTKIIKLPVGVSTEDIAIYSVAKDFIVSSGNVVTKIYSDGTYKTINMDGFVPVQFFEADGKLYAASGGGFSVSTDKGETWNLISDLHFGELSGYMFSVIEDRIIMSHGSTLKEIKFTESGYTMDELKNDGFEGNLITSVSEFKGKVYVTTLSGLFYKDVKDFFDVK